MDPDMNPSATTLCRAGCGFYGSAVTDGLCSKCFKDTLKRKQDPERLSPTAAVNTSPSLMASSTDHTPLATTSTHHAQSPCGTAACLVPTTAMPTASSSSSFGSSSHCSSASLSTAVESPLKSAGEPNNNGGDVAVGSPSSATGAAAKKKNRCHQCNKKIGLTGFACRCGGQFCSEHRYSDSHSCAFDYKALGAAEISKNNPVVVSAKIDKL